MGFKYIWYPVNVYKFKSYSFYVRKRILHGGYELLSSKDKIMFEFIHEANTLLDMELYLLKNYNIRIKL